MKAILLFPFVMIAFVFIFLYAFLADDVEKKELA